MLQEKENNRISMADRHAVLIGAGEMRNEIPDISETDFVIALDGGLQFCVEHDMKPDMIVGDFDSLSANKQGLLKQYPEEMIHRLPCEKDDTDTLAAIKLAVDQGFNRFAIYGGLGGRLSHTMANIQSLLYLKKLGLYGELIGEGCKIFLLKDEGYVLEEKTGYVSVFSFSEKADGVTLNNLKYEVEDVVLTNDFPLGVSNEFIGKTAEISVKNGTLLVVIET